MVDSEFPLTVKDLLYRAGTLGSKYSTDDGMLRFPRQKGRDVRIVFEASFEPISIFVGEGRFENRVV